MSRKAPVLIVIVTWAVLIAWRPLVLGFYHDDWWSLAVPLETPFASVMDRDPTRALFIVVVWILRKSFGANAAAWQVMAAVSHLICALLVFEVISRLHQNGAGRGAARWAGAAAGAFWLCAPWSLAYSAWPIMSLPLVTVALLASSACVLLSKQSSVRTGCAAAALFLLGGAIYEAVWGAFVPLALMAAFSRWKAGSPLQPVYAYASVSALGQVTLLVLNRLLSAPGTEKKVSSATLDTIAVSFRIAENEIRKALESTPGFLTLACLSVLAAALVISVLRRRNLDAFVYVAACAIGILGSIVLHALAGYGIEWSDVMGRTSMISSLWLSLAFGAVLTSVFAGGHLMSCGGAMATAGLLICFSWTLLAHTSDWAAGWRQQRFLVASFPIDRMGAVPPDALILADLPRSPMLRGNFDAFWDISGALAATYPKHSRRFIRDDRGQVVTLRPDFWTEWDGAKVTQGWCHTRGTPLWSLPAPNVIIWNQRQATFEAASVAERFGCTG